MKLRIMLVFALGCFVLQPALFGQNNQPREIRKAYASPEELVSLSQSTRFGQAISILNEFSKKFMNKIIVDPSNNQRAIGINISNTHWLSALEIILRHNGMWYDEFAEYLKVIPGKGAAREAQVSQAAKEARETFDSREVIISAVFFEADIGRLREAGMSWDFFRNDATDIRISSRAANTTNSMIEIEVDPSWDFADISAVFKALESDQIGEVISNPTISVASGEEGRIQVGSDISVTLQDFAGNAVTQFFSTGSIVSVRPKVMEHDSIFFVKLTLDIERSSSATSETGGGLEIRKSSAKSTVILLNGEETLIGGLQITQESNDRQGIPFLKNLPGWFFGLRYLFGYESISYQKKELLILVKADLLPTISDRHQAKLQDYQRRKLIKEYRDMQRQDMRFFKSQTKDKP